MYKIARSYFSSDEDIADAIQDTIETCYRTIAHLEDAGYFRTWLTRILINKCIDIIRKNRRERPVSEFPEYGEVSTELSSLEFNDLMNTLDEKYRTILLLYYGEGFRISEIARGSDSKANRPPSLSHTGRRKKRRAWTTIAAAAALIAGLGVTVYAAGQFVSARLAQTQDGSALTYALNVDPSEKEAHEIRVTPGYVPEGYVYQTDGPYESKWYNEKTEGSMTIIPYNAADLYLESRTLDSALQVAISKDSYVKTIEIQGMNVDIFTQENTDYIDSDDTQQDLYLFNEEWGYAVHVYLDGTDLAADEAEKIAKGLKIEVLESTVPYPTEEEIAELNREHERGNEEAAASTIVPADHIRGISDSLTIDGNAYQIYQGIEYQVEDIQVTDALSFDDFPKENFIDDSASVLAEYLNGDGSLKPHERYTGDESQTTESADAAFIIVKTKLRNVGDTETDTYLSPFLRYLDEDGSGDYTLLDPDLTTGPAESGWASLALEGFPIYQSAPDNGGKSVLFTTLDPGEEEECVSVYVIDKDRLDNAYMQYFNIGAVSEDSPELYVKVTE